MNINDLKEKRKLNESELKDLLCVANKHYSNFPLHVKDRKTAKLFKQMIDKLNDIVQQIKT